MRIAVFDCEDAEKWKGWTERLWRKLLQSPGDAFKVFSCHQDEFPDPATCRDLYDVIVIGGSHYSAYDDLPWIRHLEQLLPQYMDAGVRVVGCCFGHQILAKALGGTVGKNPSGRFVLGVEIISVDVAAAGKCGLQLQLQHQQLRGEQREDVVYGCNSSRGGGGSSGQVGAAPPPAGVMAEAADATTGANASSGRREFGGEVSPSKPRAAAAVGSGESGGGGASYSPTSNRPEGGDSERPRRLLRLLQSHGDQVLQLPPGATLLASSGTAAHEMWALGDRCLAFQFHPELTPDLVYDKIWSTLYGSGRLSAEEEAAAEAQLRAGPGAVDSGLFLEALMAYLNSPVAKPQQRCRDGSPEPAPEPAAADREEAQAASTAAAGAAEAVAGGGVRMAAELRQALEQQTGQAAEAVLAHVREAACAGLAAGTINAELLTALNREAATAYGRAATAAEGAAGRLAVTVATQQQPLKAALASLGVLEAQLDRLAAVVGSLEAESDQLEQLALRDGHGEGEQGRDRARRQQQQQQRGQGQQQQV